MMTVEDYSEASVMIAIDYLLANMDKIFSGQVLEMWLQYWFSFVSS
jgi:hypothetical protein